MNAKVQNREIVDEGLICHPELSSGSRASPILLEMLKRVQHDVLGDYQFYQHPV